ncbi:energy-coupling factor transport system ATP-binding protein [Desulfonispora thiosulfatigenes DSM 11270]|uniref:Energy-coupling factor transport system ATP-binding protein n=1 Tax=Desulfonispora thiosulfatigenes DSM 11270 TaxID=656914 RepID=A0A1W1UPB7_DESTI|nr:ABC transporter ATP-binding protein [Desulfonispora thiosulfatigenes]SMB82927.1 energy-coupling factor transport system ATP-binding protein [Desulfonispora thiosulfatigenes DSM 11270]
MAIMEIKNLNFRYPGEQENALTGVNLMIEEGSFVVLCGPSGSGKTTLLRNLKKEITPIGEKTGQILYQDKELESLDLLKSISEIGMVFQDPENQIVLDTVIQELAFSLENLGLAPEVIKKRTSEIVTFFGLEDSLDKLIHELSGGQKQIVNLCSVLMFQPKVLLLDEPTSQLDPIGAKKFIKMLYDLNQELSLTVILSEHRLEDVFPLADKIVYLEAGKIKYQGNPKQISKTIMESKQTRDLAFLPAIARMYQNLNNTSKIKTEQIPLTVREAKQFIKENKQVIKSNSRSGANEQNNNNEHNISNKLNDGVNNKFNNKSEHNKFKVIRSKSPTPDPLLKCQEIYFKYSPKSPLILKDLSLTIEAGDFLAVLGGNGAGKSTLLKVLAGLLSPQKGNVYLHNKKLKQIDNPEKYQKIGYVAQNPLLHFTLDTVEAELEHSGVKVNNVNTQNSLNTKFINAKLRNDQLIQGNQVSQITREQIITLFDLQNLFSKHPYDLSGGQQQKLAIACVLLNNPDILLLDEPTKGLDPISKVNFMQILNKLRQKGLTIIMSTHDVEFTAGYATKCALLFNGEISFSGSPTDFFSSNYYYTTAINRAIRDYLPTALTETDVIKLCNTADSHKNDINNKDVKKDDF